MTTDLLSISLAAEPVVGSNLRGSVSGAGWLYALPRLDFGRIVCLGLPPTPTLMALASIGRITLAVGPADEHRARALVARHAWPTVAVASPATGLASGTFDLIVVVDAAGASARHGDGLARLAPDGIVVTLTDDADLSVVDGPPGAGVPPRVDLERWPAHGEVRALVPAGASVERAALRRLGLLTGGGTETAVTTGQLARGERWVRRRLPANRRWGRLAILGPGDATPGGPPAYIRDLAAAAGRDLTGWSWAVAARGEYDSQKILVLLREAGSARPSAVVKVTRSSVHSDRLRNEDAALSAVGAMPIAAGRVPQRWFSGTHAGRAVLGESFAPGEPFRDRATYAPDDPLLTDALGWLTDLGAATARPVPAADVAEVLGRLLERYERVYAPDDAERVALRGLVEQLADVPAPIPLVRQHGDPGIWNLLAGPRGRTVFLDWESSEANGIPLWDVLYLFRSYAIAASRRRGTRDRVAGARRHLMASSPLSDRLLSVVEAYRDRIGVPAEAIEALTYGCWIHRSLKEASRLPRARLPRGNHVRLIRAMLAEPDAPTLARLFGRATLQAGRL